MIIAIDPAKELSRCAYCAGDDKGTWIHMGRLDSYGALHTLVGDCLEVTAPAPVRVVIEKPQIYQLGKGKGDPNDLVDVAVSVGCIVGAMRSRYMPVDVEFVKPAAWKGQVPKHIHHLRAVRHMSDDERKRIDAALKQYTRRLERCKSPPVGHDEFDAYLLYKESVK